LIGSGVIADADDPDRLIDADQRPQERARASAYRQQRKVRRQDFALLLDIGWPDLA